MTLTTTKDQSRREAEAALGKRIHVVLDASDIGDECEVIADWYRDCGHWQPEEIRVLILSDFDPREENVWGQIRLQKQGDMWIVARPATDRDSRPKVAGGVVEVFCVEGSY